MLGRIMWAKMERIRSESSVRFVVRYGGRRLEDRSDQVCRQKLAPFEAAINFCLVGFSKPKSSSV